MLVTVEIHISLAKSFQNGITRHQDYGTFFSQFRLYLALLLIFHGMVIACKLVKAKRNLL